ncbi:hypothetical protein BGZ49_005592 [Haplosporangium sp. Z 27]|nr:hypothetical protein BGZ49_005592 [Haplosporangium sp. Z 27]
MSTVTERLHEAHENLLQLYTSIPILTPCLEKIKTNQAEFVAISARLRQQQESHTAATYKVERAKKQLVSVFNINNKSERAASVDQGTNELKAIENERRICLRQRDEIVTERYKLQKERVKLLEETRQLKKLNESVFDRSKDEVANTDFPEELHWQFELKEYDLKIGEVRRQLSKYKTAQSNLARAANLSEAALVAFLGYPEAAYKIWKVEYALKASQKMRLYLRVELSLSNAYSNEDAARQACPSILPTLATPIKPSLVQAFFEPMPLSKKRESQKAVVERLLRYYIGQLRSAHRTAETLVAQETQRLSAMERYRESIVPRLSKIRRRVFQDLCLGGYQIEGWEDEQGRSLLGTEADILVRGGIHEVDTVTPIPASSSIPSSQSVPNLQQRNSADDLVYDDEEYMNTRRPNGTHARVPDLNEHEDYSESNRAVVAHDGRVVVSAGAAPLSIVAPSNVLGSEILKMVDLDRQVKLEKLNKAKEGHGSKAFSAFSSLILNRDSSSNNSANNNLDGANSGSSSQRDREETKRTSRGFFGFTRSRRGSSNGEDAIVPSDHASLSPVFEVGRNARSSVDVSNTGHGRGDVQRGHHRNVPSISISNYDEGERNSNPFRRTLFENASLVQLPSWNTQSMATSDPSSPSVAPIRPRVLSMDDYIGIGEVAEQDNGERGSQPLIPSYQEHHQDQIIDPELLHLMNSSISYEGLSSLSELEEERDSIRNGDVSWRMQGVSHPGHHDTWSTPGSEPSDSLSTPSEAAESRSRPLSPPHSYGNIHQSISDGDVNGISDNRSNGSGAESSASRMHYQYHGRSVSDQLPEGVRGVISSQMELLPPPDYAVRPPQYSA